MAYCSIDEAFPVSDPAGSVARREERRRAKQCKGPALAFLKAGGDGGVDVDRQGYGRAPEPELLSGVKGRGDREGFADASGAVEDREVDVIGSKQTKRNSTLPDPAAVQKTTELPKLAAEVPSYFGRGEEDAAAGASNTSAAARATPLVPKGIEQFADFSKLPGDNPGYRLAPDFMATFEGRGYDKSAGTVIPETPQLEDAWKPITPTGAQTSYLSEWRPSGGGGGGAGRGRAQGRSAGGSWDSGSVGSGGGSMSREEKEYLLKRIDLLFAKLERLEGGRSENAQTEIALFVLSGLFLMFGLDVVRRAAGGA